MESNLQAVQRSLKAFTKHNVAPILDICSDDVLWESYDNPAVAFAGSFRGKEGVRRFFDLLAQEVEFVALTPREFVSNGDVVVALGRHIGRMKRSGKPFDHEWAMVFRFRDSKVYSFFCFVDTREQAEASRGSVVDERREVFPTSTAGQS